MVRTYCTSIELLYIYMCVHMQVRGHSQRMSEPTEEGCLENQDKLGHRGGGGGGLAIRMSEIKKNSKENFFFIYFELSFPLKNSLIIHEENTKKNHKRVVSVYVIQIHVDLHKL